MPLLDVCCCWRDMKKAVIASGTFTLVTSIQEILIIIAVFSVALEVFGTALFTYSSDLPIYIMYLVFFGMDILLMILSGFLLSATERRERDLRRMKLWLFFLPIYIIYEASINIYFFYSAIVALQNGMQERITKYIGFILVPMIYWVIKLLVNIFGYMSVYSELQDLRRHVKSVKIKSKHSNIYYGLPSADDYPNHYPRITNNNYPNHYLPTTKNYQNIGDYIKAKNNYALNYQERSYNKPANDNYQAKYAVADIYPSKPENYYPIKFQLEADYQRPTSNEMGADEFGLAPYGNKPLQYRQPDADYPAVSKGGLPRTPWFGYSSSCVLENQPMVFTPRQFMRKN